EGSRDEGSAAFAAEILRGVPLRMTVLKARRRCSSAPALCHDIILELDEHVSSAHVLVAAGEDQEDVAVAFLGLLVAVVPKLMPRLDLLFAGRLTERRE